jgi:hypothetical protein
VTKWVHEIAGFHRNQRFERIWGRRESVKRLLQVAGFIEQIAWAHRTNGTLRTGELLISDTECRGDEGPPTELAPSALRQIRRRHLPSGAGITLVDLREQNRCCLVNCRRASTVWECQHVTRDGTKSRAGLETHPSGEVCTCPTTSWNERALQRPT